MNYFMDCEFIEDGKTIDLISIGIVAEDGQEIYLQNWDADLDCANDWVKENVIPHLSDMDCKNGVKACPPYHGCRWVSHRLMGFEAGLIVATDPDPVFWAYYADYDWVAFCQLFGTMMDLPSGWPMYCRDLRQSLDDMGLQHITQPDDAPHHALLDAKWVRDTWKQYVFNEVKEIRLNH